MTTVDPIYLLADAINALVETMKACASRWRKPCKRRGNRSGKCRGKMVVMNNTSQNQDTQEETCTVKGCDRVASRAPDDHGDLCGAHRDAEFALGREPHPH